MLDSFRKLKYKILRNVLFLFDPEKTHNFIFIWLKFWYKIPFISSSWINRYTVKDSRLTRNVFGIDFPNPVGLAAGFDKDGRLINELSCFGFGFIEIGTLTPKNQEGNPRPRIFRCKEDKAIINRLGFNNSGVEDAIVRLRARKSTVIIGANIGKNKNTSNENAKEDYLFSFNRLFNYVDYFVVNVSSPNTPDLRDLQEKKPLFDLLMTLQKENDKKERRKPILLKISPDLTNSQLDNIIETVSVTRIDGVIATNTTITRDNLITNKKKINKIGDGGLSGYPLQSRSTEVIRYISEKSNKSFPIIGVGGIHSDQDAIEKINAGADLVQIYTGFIYEGPDLIRSINHSIIDYENY